MLVILLFGLSCFIASGQDAGLVRTRYDGNNNLWNHDRFTQYDFDEAYDQSLNISDGSGDESAEITFEGEGISIVPSAAILGLGDEQVFTVIFEQPAVSDKNISWFSGDESIVSIDTEGKARGMGVGSSFIYAVSAEGGFSDTAKIKVITSTELSYEIEEFLMVEGQMRRYLLFHPGRGTNLPVVLCLHGRGSRPENMRDGTGFNILAKKEGFIAVYPSAIEPALAWEMEGGMKFISLLIDRLNSDYDIDLNRVYATGFSAGGYLSNYLGNRLSDKIAAIAPVEAGIIINWNLTKPPRGVPVCIIHNRFDSIVPYASGIDTRDKWISWNKTATSPQQVILNDDPPVLLDVYNNGRDKSIVEFYTVEYTYYSGHSWPWKESTGLDATSEAIWPFFRQHTLDGRGTTGLEEIPEDTGFRVFPNPVTNGEIMLVFSADARSVRHIRIYDLAGKPVYKGSIHTDQGRNHIHVSLPDIDHGIYLLRMGSEDDQFGSYTDNLYTCKIIIN